MQIGFIGLGNMGRPMACNLLAAGYAISGFDLHVPCPEGIAEAKTAAEAATGADIVITMLPDGDALRQTAEAILPVMRAGTFFLDCSTVDVETARDVAKAAKDVSVAMLDAPVSGGIGGAVSGNLTFMVGGSEDAFAQVEPLFAIMGKKAVHCGESGAGQAAKICNNMILGINMIGTCEGINLADRLGLDRQKLFDVVSTSSGYSWVMNAYCPAPGIGPTSPADNDYKPGFSADLMLKDLRLAQQAAELVDADTPLGQVAEHLYEKFVETEDGQGRDFSAMLPRLTARSRDAKAPLKDVKDSEDM